MLLVVPSDAIVGGVRLVIVAVPEHPSDPLAQLTVTATAPLTAEHPCVSLHLISVLPPWGLAGLSPGGL